MKKTRISVLVTAILVSSIAVFAACQSANGNIGGNGGQNGANGGNHATATMSARDVYALSAVSGVSYLSGGESSVGTVGALMRRAQVITASRPDEITDSDVTGIGRCIDAFDNILLGGGVDQTVRENTSTDARFSGYALEMNISMPVGSGALEGYTMYFNELEKRTEVEMDDGEEEVEETTTFEGVILYQEALFVVKGVQEVETEGTEKETSLEFRTYKNIGVDSVQADENNFIVVSQSVEKDEVEYEYSFYENGRKVQEIELEYEEDIRGVELSFQIKDIASGRVEETEYELRKKENGFVIELEKKGQKDSITVVQVENGYRFTYSNGFEEVIG